MRKESLRGAVGDVVAVASPGHTTRDRRGEIRAVFGEPENACYLVRWPDGRESMLAAEAGQVLSHRKERLQRRTRVSVLGDERNETSVELVQRWRELGLDAELISPLRARTALRPGDTVLARLDVLPTLDGVEPGLLELLWLERRGVRVLNPAVVLLAVHDKLRTARRLAAVGLPHPHGAVVRAGEPLPFGPPLVLKPRFGSWGRDVLRCRDRAELMAGLALVHGRPWFRRHGVLVQELLPTSGRDLRLLVAEGEVVGAGERVAAPGEWRTNVSLGGRKRPVEPTPHARELARAAAAAVGADLVGVDLAPLRDGGYAVLELNGAVDFDDRYALGGSDIYLRIAQALELAEERSTI